MRRRPIDLNRTADDLRAYASKVGYTYPQIAAKLWTLANDLQGRGLAHDRSYKTTEA
jgi:hypothetical protein